jgi:hypothetical protein
LSRACLVELLHAGGAPWCGSGRTKRSNWRGRRPDQVVWRPMTQKNAAAPLKVFDDLYFFRTTWVSARAIGATEGIILVDENKDDEVARSKIGSPSPPGQRDFAGAKTSASWESRSPKFGNVPWEPPAKPDMSVVDGQKLQLRDATVDQRAADTQLNSVYEADGSCDRMPSLPPAVRRAASPRRVETVECTISMKCARAFLTRFDSEP